ncbi:MAG: AAA family ATPase, partial [Clostridia bacterium]|nr:AAA family ATPase [Clostridia bacterium]
MEYIKRDLERKFLHMCTAFKAVMVVGARQVGKSTMLKHLAKDQNRTYVTMDDTQLRTFAQTDPKLFLQTYQPPILIDEVQKAPELFEEIKILCDESDERGRFWLTGSQSKKLVKKAGDSLAGRLCVLKMYSLSAREKLGVKPEDDLDFSLKSLAARKRLFGQNNILSTFENIWRGGLPDV